MKYLKPLIFRPLYFVHIEDEINFIFASLIYRPLLKLLQPEHSEIKNDKFELLEYIRSGRVYFNGEIFTADPSAKIARAFKEMGAIFDKRKGGWKFTKIPPDVQIAIGVAKVNFRQMNAKILEMLDNIDINIIDHAAFTEAYETSLSLMNEDIDSTLQRISVPMNFTPGMKAEIAKQWGENLKLYIKNWAGDNILKLRQQVLINAANGHRAENLVDLIQRNYTVSRNKAKFLARQETSLLMSKFREQRYKDGGIQKYKWSGVMDERERPDHKLLENKIYTWDAPPVVDRKTGRRAHPGEDYNCRCVAVPVLEF